MKYKRSTEKTERGFYKYKCTEEDKEDCDLMEYCSNCYGSKVLTRLGELEDKIEQGTLIELPCVIVGNGAIDAFGKVRVPYYQVLWLDEFGFMKIFRTTDREEAEKRLKELQNG